MVRRFILSASPSLRSTHVRPLLTTGLEPVTQGEQILSLSCLPISPSELIGAAGRQLRRVRARTLRRRDLYVKSHHEVTTEAQRAKLESPWGAGRKGRSHTKKGSVTLHKIVLCTSNKID